MPHAFPFLLTSVGVTVATALLCLSGLTSGRAQAATEKQATQPAEITTSPVSKLADNAAPENWALHGQLTNVTQGHRRFRSPYSGTNNLIADGRTEETTDIILHAGVRLWRGAEFWINPEIGQGSGLRNTVGMAVFPSGEAYKIGANVPYLRLPRAFLRQVISLSGESVKTEAAANQLAGSKAANNVTLTLGKFSATDLFDTNAYARDPWGDFLKWSTIDAGAFEYAADTWGSLTALTCPGIFGPLRI